MLFNSFSFLLFFPIVVLIYFLLPIKAKNIWLLLASYFFYMSWNPKYAILLFFCTMTAYIAALVLEQKKKESIFILALILIFLTLFYFKYVNFALSTVVKAMGIVGVELTIPKWDIVLPVGISFFTFQSAGYLIDVYRGEIKAEHNFFRFVLFVSFFPQLVAGPIERSKNLISQLEHTYTFDFERFRDGFYLMLWGYFLKLIIADRAAIFVDRIYALDSNTGGGLILVATILFAFQIYGDFSGYSMIAIGAAKIIGINLMENFNSPYLSESTKDFWNRWHISLNTWFRDYLYIPLGGNRKGKRRKYINLLTVFLISGLWHGASWNFVFWGFLNGLYQVLGEVIRPIRDKLWKMLSFQKESFSFHFLQGLITFFLIDFAWLFFRANGIMDGVQRVKCIISDFRVIELSKSSLFSYGLNENNFRVLFLSILTLLGVDYFKKRGLCIRKWVFQQDAWFRIGFTVFAIMFIVIFGVWGSAYDAQSFIYFRF